MIKILATNLVDQSVISATSENLLFPLSNLKHPFRSKVFRSTSNSTSVVFDLLETSEIDSIMVVPEKRNGFGVASITLELNATSDFSTPGFSVALEINTKHNLAKAFFALQEYRFARIVLTSTLGYCEVSKVFIGKAIEFENGSGIDLGWKYQDKTLSTSKKNGYGQKFIDKRPRQKNISFALRALNQDELDQVFELYDGNGSTKPFFMFLGTADMINDPARFSGMFFMENEPDILNRSFALYDLGVQIEEAM